MFLQFFDQLRKTGVPVSLREYLGFLGTLEQGLATYDIDAFYYLGRITMVKDERHLDRYDRAFSNTFKGLENISLSDVLEAVNIPAEWLEKLAEKHLSADEMAEIKSLGGFDKFYEQLDDQAILHIPVIPAYPVCEHHRLWQKHYTWVQTVKTSTN